MLVVAVQVISSKMICDLNYVINIKTCNLLSTYMCICLGLQNLGDITVQNLFPRDETKRVLKSHFMCGHLQHLLPAVQQDLC